jgi:hypothetical protein
MKPLKLIVIVAIICLQSCTKPVDFDQIDDAEIKANYLLTQVYFDLVADDFLDEFGAEIPLQNDIIQAPINDSSQKYLEKIEFTVVTANSFSRDFNVQIVLYDQTQTPIYIVQPTIQIPANSSEITTTIEISNGDISKVFNTEYFTFFVQLLPSNNGSVITSDTSGVLNFKSYVTLFLNYKTE